MGIGNSRENYKSKPRRQSPAPKPGRYGGKKRRRGFLRKIRRVSTTLPIMPIKYHSPYRYSYGAFPYIPPISAYAPLPSSVYPRYTPLSYNNYAAQYYSSPLRQPIMISPQQFQPMVIPQQVPQSQPIMIPQPMMMPQQVPQSQPMMMPQQVPQFQPMAMPQQVSPSVFSPYISSPYSTGVPFSTPYSQQQPQVGPIYNNAGVSARLPTGMIGQSTPYSSPYPPPYQGANVQLSTDWTGGGKISPGFLGPPI